MLAVAGSLFRYGRIRTTEARAKEVRRIAERAITVAKGETLSARRRLERSFSPPIVRKLMTDIAPKYHDRRGGYTRIVKLPRRSGDRSPMAFIELV
jgi:large subunit ribosomal protein L17